jgi:hypothetical protein
MRIIPFIALSSALLASCDQAPPPTGSGGNGNPANPTWPATQMTDGGAFSVTVAPIQGTILRNEHFSLDLLVEPQQADPGPLQVKVDADMPAHRHGMHTQPEVTAYGKNKYRVDGMLFHMSGDWVITVEVGANGTTEQANIPVLID